MAIYSRLNLAQHQIIVTGNRYVHQSRVATFASSTAILGIGECGINDFLIQKGPRVYGLTLGDRVL